MAYITTTQLEDRLGSTLYARLTDRVNGTTPDSKVAGQIVDEAEASADSYLRPRPVRSLTTPKLSSLAALVVWARSSLLRAVTA